MNWGAVVGTVAGGLLGSSSANKAAKQQARAQQQAINLQREMWQTTRDDLAPYREAGQSALNPLTALVTDPAAQRDYVMANPFYNAMRQQATDSVMANQAARGMLGSGYTAGALQDRYLALGDQILNSQYNRLTGLAGIGQNSAAGTASANMQAGNALSDLIQGIGNSQAAGTVGRANAIGSALEQGASFLGDYFARNRNRNRGLEVTRPDSTW
jgi:hypothetical protein